MGGGNGSPRGRPLSVRSIKTIGNGRSFGRSNERPTMSKAEQTQTAKINGTDHDLQGIASFTEAIKKQMDNVIRDQVEENKRAISDVMEKLEEISDRLEELDERLPDTDQQDYDQMSRAQKISHIRRVLREDAENTRSGKSSMDYRDVWNLFDRKPSEGHATDLMKAAEDGEVFVLHRFKDRNNQLRYDSTKE